MGFEFRTGRESGRGASVIGPRLEDVDSYRWRIDNDPRLDYVIQAIFIQGARWKMGANQKPLHLKRRDLYSFPRGWHEFIVHNIMPSGNKSEVTVSRAVLIHSIMIGEDVRAERYIAQTMAEIAKNLPHEKPNLAFFGVIH
ncbi:hypothetical protein PIB30_057154 [Stylosanthes scabra]|uniref:Putative plant transposon protein domain-containing protein n=1 Tax=Stylosanthes scabra TaxID=79078 RepID=A0ABU6WHY0_9FABA|nr:hypothetical protein [Stylosanthes scabra]